MKLSREVQITLRPDGTVEVVTHGFRGRSCVSLTEFFEKAVAGPEPERKMGDVIQTLQPEYYQQEVAEEENQHGSAT